MIMEVLADFGIPLNQVLCCVTDNAANMVKVVKDFNVDLAAAAQPQSSSSQGDQDQEDSDSDEDEDKTGDDDMDLPSLLEYSLPPTITHIRCGVHTLQLAIMDGLKNPGATSIVRRIRNVAVELRTPKVAEKLKSEGHLMAILDQETRWGSTYMMVDRVLALKGFVNESDDLFQKGLHITPPQWKQMQELRDLLKKSYEVTKKMQSDDLTPGYFYRKWTGLLALMQQHTSVIADIIVASMKKRGNEFLHNSLFLAAIYLDINNQDLLTTSQKKEAKAAVLELVIRLKGLDSEAMEDDMQDSPVSAGHSALDSDSDEEMNAARRASKSLTSASSGSEAEFEISEPGLTSPASALFRSTSRTSSSSPKVTVTK